MAPPCHLLGSVRARRRQGRVNRRGVQRSGRVAAGRGRCRRHADAGRGAGDRGATKLGWGTKGGSVFEHKRKTLQPNAHRATKRQNRRRNRLATHKRGKSTMLINLADIAESKSANGPRCDSRNEPTSRTTDAALEHAVGQDDAVVAGERWCAARTARPSRRTSPSRRQELDPRRSANEAHFPFSSRRHHRCLIQCSADNDGSSKQTTS